MKKNLIGIIIPCSLILSLVGLVIAIQVDINKEYENCLTYPLDTNWVEEDLEPIFMTTDVCCLDWWQEENHAYYDVSANGFYYRCHYAIGRVSLGYPHWKYQNHIQINYEEKL